LRVLEVIQGVRHPELGSGSEEQKPIPTLS
jgi:hypothetical protein